MGNRVSMLKYQVGDLVKVKEEAAEDWDNMMELYDVDPESLGIITKVTAKQSGNYRYHHYYDVLFQNKTRALHFDHDELETVW
jgi:hypothetical protein